MTSSDRYQTLVALAMDSLSRLGRVVTTSLSVSAMAVYVRGRDGAWHRGYASADFPTQHADEQRLVDALDGGQVTVVERAGEHPALGDHPWVGGERGLQFWAAAPMTSSRSETLVGLLVVAAAQPQTLDDRGRQTLADLAALATERLDLQLNQADVAAEMDRIITIGILAAGVAHEINNPLSFVGGNLQFALRLLEEQAAGEVPAPIEATLTEVADALHDALEGSRRVRDVVRDLHRLAGGSDSGEFTIEPVSVTDSLKTSLNIARKHIERRAQLRVDLDELPMVLGNESKLGQVFLNLLVNAAQAIAPGDVAHNEVRVRTEHRDGDVIVSISDTGRGIADEHMAHIFEPFFTTKPTGEGTGLGLAISHSIIAMLSGEIEVATTPGTGTTFRVVLPTVDKAVGSL